MSVKIFSDYFSPAEERAVLKKSFNLKLFETKSVQIATFVGLGRID